MAQGWGPASLQGFLALPGVNQTCGYCDLCDYHRTREQLLAEEGSVWPIGWIPLTQWKMSTGTLSSPHSGNEADSSGSGDLEFCQLQ